MYSPNDINMLARIADPGTAAKAAANGLPTIDPAQFKQAVVANKEAKNVSLIGSAITMVESLMSGAEKMIEDLMKSKAPAVPGVAAPDQEALDEANEKKIAEVKLAKEHAEATGNFVPLLAVTNPNVSLKSLPKNVVMPDMSGSSVNFIVDDWNDEIYMNPALDPNPKQIVFVKNALPNVTGYATRLITVPFTTDANGNATVVVDFNTPVNGVSSKQTYTFVIPGCTNLKKTCNVIIQL